MAESELGSLFVGNIPPQTTEVELRDAFSNIGPIKRIHLTQPKNRGHSAPQIAYVTYALPDDATTALEKFSKLTWHGSKLHVKVLKKRKDIQHEKEQAIKAKNTPNRETKTARLIIRNVSFRAKKTHLKNQFEKYGPVTEVMILKKRDGKSVGCAFVQFHSVHDASRALKELNGTLLLGRPIAVDWALPKSVYEHRSRQDHQSIKKEPSSVTEPTEVPDDLDDERVLDVKSQVLLKENSEGSEDEVEADGEGELHTGDDHDENDLQESNTQKPMAEQRKKRVGVSRDVKEGRTIFVRNLSFETEEDDLANLMTQFGEVKYALICINPLTEHPKGTAFVQFKDSEAVEKCLNHGEEIYLDGRLLDVKKALDRQTLDERKPEKKGKDSRNLYLLKEGRVSRHMDSRKDMSQHDLDLRHRLDSRKAMFIKKNLNMFISPNRLCVHNIPKNYSDKDLKKLFIEYGGPGAKVTEARIMRNLKKLDANGIPESKGFGFVAFSQHEHALAALRGLNDHPNVFSEHRRPIVEFSVENREALNAKLRRAERSRAALIARKNNMGKEGVSESRTVERKDEKSFIEAKRSMPLPNPKGNKRVMKQKGPSAERGAMKPSPMIESQGKFPVPSNGLKIKQKQELIKKPANYNTRKSQNFSQGEVLIQSQRAFEKEMQQKKKRKLQTLTKNQGAHSKEPKFEREVESFQRMVDAYRVQFESVPEQKRKKWYE